jgi:FHA domain
MDSQQQSTQSHTSSSHPRLALIDICEASSGGNGNGRALRSVDVLAWPLTVGRALDNHIVIDDPFVAAHHALLDTTADGSLQLSVLDTVNGAQLDSAQLDANGLPTDQLMAGHTRVLPVSGALLKLGNTRLRLRLPHEALAPEQALPPITSTASPVVPASSSTAGRLWPWLAGVGLMAFELGSHWTGLDPGADFSAWLPLLLGVPVAVVVWCGVWALLSKLFNHHFDFAGHLKLALPWLLTLAVTQALWPQMAASLAAPFLWRLTPLLMVVLTAFLVRAHLSHVLPNKRQAVAVGAAAMAAGAVGISAIGNYRSHDSLSSAPYMSTLPLPALRLGGTGSTGGEQKLVQGLAPLAAGLAQRVKKARDDEEDGDGAAD